MNGAKRVSKINTVHDFHRSQRNRVVADPDTVSIKRLNKYFCRESETARK